MRYSLYSNNTQEFSDFFAIEEETGIITLQKAVDFDDPFQTKIFHFYGIFNFIAKKTIF